MAVLEGGEFLTGKPIWLEREQNRRRGLAAEIETVMVKNPAAIVGLDLAADKRAAE